MRSLVGNDDPHLARRSLANGIEPTRRLSRHAHPSHRSRGAIRAARRSRPRHAFVSSDNNQVAIASDDCPGGPPSPLAVPHGRTFDQLPDLLLSDCFAMTSSSYLRPEATSTHPRNRTRSRNNGPRGCPRSRTVPTRSGTTPIEGCFGIPSDTTRTTDRSKIACPDAPRLLKSG